MTRLAIRGWLLGVVVYLVALRFTHRLPLGGDAIMLLLWTALATIILIPALYLPALRSLHQRLQGRRPRSAFIALGIALGIVPFAIISIALTRSVGALLSPEALTLFYLFAVMGAVIGLGWSPPAVPRQ